MESSFAELCARSSFSFLPGGASHPQEIVAAAKDLELGRRPLRIATGSTAAMARLHRGQGGGAEGDRGRRAHSGARGIRGAPGHGSRRLLGTSARLLTAAHADHEKGDRRRARRAGRRRLGGGLVAVVPVDPRGTRCPPRPSSARCAPGLRRPALRRHLAPPRRLRRRATARRARRRGPLRRAGGGHRAPALPPAGAQAARGHPPLRPAPHHARRGGHRARAQRRGHPPLGRAHAGALPRSPGAGAAHRGGRRPLQLLDGRAPLRLPQRHPLRARRDGRRRPPPPGRRGRGAPLPRRDSAGGAGADRQGARPHRKAPGGALLPQRPPDRGDRPGAAHPLPGPRERGQQRGLLRPRHHRGRPLAHVPALRALPRGRAPRAARHRRRLRARAPRGGDPGHLRHVRPRPRRHGLRDHRLPRPERAARGGQGLRALARSGRPALRPGHPHGSAGALGGPRHRGRARPRGRAAPPGGPLGRRDRGLPPAPLHPRGRLRPPPSPSPASPRSSRRAWRPAP